MATSSVVAAGDDATATQYNNLRTDAITRYVRFFFSIEGTVAAANALQVIAVPAGMTVTKIKHRCTSGSGTLTVKTVAGNTIKSGMSVTTSYTDQTSSLTNTSLSEGDELQIDLTSASSLVNLRVIVYCTETI